jgi:hypothetical protein
VTDHTAVGPLRFITFRIGHNVFGVFLLHFI